MQASGAIHCADERTKPTFSNIKTRMVITETTVAYLPRRNAMPPLPITKVVEDEANKRTTCSASTGIGVYTVVIDHATGEFNETIMGRTRHLHGHQ